MYEKRRLFFKIKEILECSINLVDQIKIKSSQRSISNEYSSSSVRLPTLKSPLFIVDLLWLDFELVLSDVIFLLFVFISRVDDFFPGLDGA